MSTGQHLNVQPSELKFPFELKKQSSCTMQLTNKSDKHVAFKVKTTNPKKYCVRPKLGIVLPRSTCNITLTMQAQENAPPDMKCNDKFLLQSVPAPDGTTTKDITPDMFKKEHGKIIEEFKLEVVYVLRESGVLVVQPSDSKLKFPFELNKQISSTMQLTNKTDEHVAYKVRTTNRKNYCVRPNAGIVLPRSTCNITVTMQTQRTEPPDMKCNDKFLLQCTPAPNGSITKDIILDMFNKEDVKILEEFKLHVAYIPAYPSTSLEPEESEEGSNENFITSGSFWSTWFGKQKYKKIKNQEILYTLL